jgi:hypothetical protein
MAAGLHGGGARYPFFQGFFGRDEVLPCGTHDEAAEILKEDVWPDPLRHLAHGGGGEGGSGGSEPGSSDDDNDAPADARSSEDGDKEEGEDWSGGASDGDEVRARVCVWGCCVAAAPRCFFDTPARQSQPTNASPDCSL